MMRLNLVQKWILGLVAALLGGLGWIALETPKMPSQSLEQPIGASEPLLAGEESLFAEIDSDGNVLRVIVVSEEVISSGLFGNPKNWVRSYADGRIRGFADNKYDRKTDKFISSEDEKNN